MSEHSISGNQDSQSEDNFQNLAPQQPPSPKPRQSSYKKKIQDVSPMIKVPPKQLNLAKENKPRLIIDRIILENFKSYAGKQIIGPFHENFTSVVGPNGSGKSNLIESMLFIFGYNASWMRLNRLNQLIHNSSTMNNISKASVEVQFKKILEVEEGKFTQILDSNFSIRRTVNSSNVSKYFINGHDSTQGEIKERLKSEGIDLNNNRFLILQGEVEQISQMKQKSGDRDKPGILEYLEDIIGSSQYIDKIEENINEFNKIEEIRHEKGEIMKIVETELKSMNKGKEEAIKYVKKEKQIYQIQNILNQVIMSNNKFEQKECNKKLQKLQKQKQRIVEEEKEKLKKQRERITKIKGMKSEIEMMEKKLIKLDDSLNKLNIEDQNLNQEIVFKSEDYVKYKKKIDSLEQQRMSIINESDEIEKTLKPNSIKKEAMEKELHDLKEELRKYDNSEFTKQLKKLQNQLKQQEHEISSFNDKLKLTKRNFDKKYNTSNSEVRKAELQLEESNANGSLEKINEALEGANAQNEELKKEFDHIDKKKKVLKNELEKIQMILREQQNQNKERGMVNNMFEKIMDEKIPGVIGRLGDLGSVREKKYDEIITSCCGGRLDNIVVTNYEAAKAVTDYLKRTKLGRITCIILDIVSKQVGDFMRKNWQNLPNSTRLFDVIDPVSEDVKVAFYFAISDTIYCEDSNLGMKYAMGDDMNRRRVISRKTNGYIIFERNGMMNGCPAKRGGFDVKAKAKMRNPANSKELKEQEEKKKTLIKELATINSKLEEVMKNIKETDGDIVLMKKQKNKSEGKIRQCRQEMEDIDKILLQNSKNFEIEKKNKEAEIKGIEEKINELVERSEEIKNTIEQIEEERKKSETSEINKKREKYKEIRNKFHELEKNIEKHKAIIKNTEKRIKQNKQEEEKSKKMMEKLEKDLERLKEKREKIESEAGSMIVEQDEINEKVKEIKEEENKLKRLFEDDERIVKESKKKIEQARQEVENCKEQMKKFEEGISFAQLELSRVRQTYKQLIQSYDFLQDLERIEEMKLDGIKYSEQNSIMETSVLLNQSMSFSLDKSMTSSRVFPLQQLTATSPFQDLDEQSIDPFLLFHEKLVSFLVSETQALKKLSGNNILIINEYRSKYTDYKDKLKDFQAVVERQKELKTLVEELKRKRLSEFKEGFMAINLKLKEVYQLLTRGGDAELELIDSLDPFSEGINFSVRPPKKTWKEINKLSGGEKTLSSLSLIFALHYYKPTPLYFMDEIDAALDFKNVSIVAQYIKKRTKDAQFIIISLRNNMFDLANKLVGVYKTFDQTKIVQFIPQLFKQAHKFEKENLDKNMIVHSS